VIAAGSLLVLTGPVHSGKTTFLRDAASRWTEAGFRVGGFLSLLRKEGGLDQGYDLFDLREGTARPFLELAGGTGWQAVGPWRLRPATLEAAEDILRRDSEADILLIDEIGPLERGGGGLWPAFAGALAGGARCLCVIREEILEGFRAKIAPVTPAVFRHRDPGTFESLTAALASLRSGRERPGGPA